MTNTVTIATRNIGNLARLGMLIGLVAALLLASQADTFARERDEQPEEPRREEPRDNSMEDDPADNGNSMEDDPADNGNSMEEDPADNGNSMTEVELDPIVVRSINSQTFASAGGRQSADLVKEEIAFAYKTITFNY